MPSTESVLGAAPPLGDLPTSELLTHGHAALAWIARYLDHPERVSVLSRAVPGEIREMLPTSPPEQPEPLGDILRDFESQIVPGITHWNHPGFFGYFATSSSVPGILGELLVAALDVKAMLWRTSPAATELEQVTTWPAQRLVRLSQRHRLYLVDARAGCRARGKARARHPRAWHGRTL